MKHKGRWCKEGFGDRVVIGGEQFYPTSVRSLCRRGQEGLCKSIQPSAGKQSAFANRIQPMCFTCTVQNWDRIFLPNPYPMQQRRSSTIMVPVRWEIVREGTAISEKLWKQMDGKAKRRFPRPLVDTARQLPRTSPIWFLRCQCRFQT